MHLQYQEQIMAGYVRLSKEDEEKQLESESVQNQKALLASYAEERGWKLHNIYVDEDYSGVDSMRPEFNQLLTEAEKGKFNIVVCKSQSRFTRDMEAVEKYIHHKFVLWGIRFISITDNADTSVKGNKKARQINGLINEWYLEDLSENVRTVLEHKRKTGQFIGSFATYGYQKDPENRNHLLSDPVAAENVRLIFQLYLQGMGKTRLLRQHIDTYHEQKDAVEYLQTDRYQQKRQALLQEIKALNGDVIRRKTAVREIYMDKADGLITAQQFADYSQGYQAEINRMEARIPLLQEELETLDEQKADLDALQRKIDRWLDFRELNRELVLEFVDYV